MKPRVERVTWCLTTGGYADEERCKGAAHDHYDLAVDYDSLPGLTGGGRQGKVLWRVDPVGTTYLLPDGAEARLTKYEDAPFIEPPIDDAIYPRYDVWTARGGAAGGVDVADVIWDGATLREGVVRIVVVPGDRPAPGSAYVRPNGEVWRLRGYGPDWKAERYEHIKPSWSIALPSGAQTNGGDDLPEDARLVWAP